MHMTYLEGKSNEKNVFFFALRFFSSVNATIHSAIFLFLWWDIMHYIAKCKETTVYVTATYCSLMFLMFTRSHEMNTIMKSMKIITGIEEQENLQFVFPFTWVFSNFEVYKLQGEFFYPIWNIYIIFLYVHFMTPWHYYIYICSSFFKHVSSLIKSVSQNYCIGGEWRRIVSALFLLRRLLGSIICSKQNQTHNF